jgi:starch phosphorylase
MNGSLNLSIPDGWVPEFAQDGVNSFIIPTADDSLSVEEKDKIEAKNLLDLLENKIIPMYYESPDKWLKMMKTSMRGVVPQFDGARMANEYYEKMYIPD